MLPREYRLVKNKDFDNVWQKGRSCYGIFLGIRFVQNGANQSRFGFLVSNKVSKRAVKRNLIKRRLRAIIHEKLAEIAIGYDIIVLTKPEIINKEFKEISSEILLCLKKTKLLKN
jgi:ribonuclease P protein component